MVMSAIFKYIRISPYVMSKKGISPLFATVLLIAFSVFLGVMVMNWGESYVEKKAEFVRDINQINTGCDAVQLNIVSLQGKEQLCQTDSYVKAILQNGQERLYDLKAGLIGTDGVSNIDTALGKPLEPSSITEVKFVKTNTGDVQQIRLTPKIVRDNEIVYCTKVLTFEPVPVCE